MLIRVAHVNLSINDLESARNFYGRVLGLEQADRPPEAGRAGYWFRLGEFEIHLSEDRGMDNARSKRHVAFEVRDLDALRRRLSEAGVLIEEGRSIGSARRFFARDPAGNRLEFYEPA